MIYEKSRLKNQTKLKEYLRRNEEEKKAISKGGKSKR